MVEVVIEAKELGIIDLLTDLFIKNSILLEVIISLLGIGLCILSAPIPIPILEISDFLIDVLEHLCGLIFKLINRNPQSIDPFQNLHVLHLLDHLLESLLQLGMAFPQLGVQVIEDLESVVFTQLHSHLE